MFSFQQNLFSSGTCCIYMYYKNVVDYGDDVITNLGKQLTKLSLCAADITDDGYLHLKNCAR
jgi:hypothetical protein